MSLSISSDRRIGGVCIDIFVDSAAAHDVYWGMRRILKKKNENELKVDGI